MPSICPSCRAEIKPEYKFCRQCGAALRGTKDPCTDATQPSSPSPTVAPMPPPQTKLAETDLPEASAPPRGSEDGPKPSAGVERSALAPSPPLVGAGISQLISPSAPSRPAEPPHPKITDRQPASPRKTEAPIKLTEGSTISPPVGLPSSRRQPEQARRAGGGLRKVLVPVIILAVLVAGGAAFYFSGGTLEGMRSSLSFVPGLGSSKPPARAEQYVGQGMSYASLKDFDNAVREFTRAIELSPNYAVAYANRGVAYMQQKKLNLALDDLKKAAELSPKDNMVHYNLAALYTLQGQNDRALASLDKALELGFNQYSAFRNDPDLRRLRDDPEFQKVLERHKVFLK